MTFDNIHSLLRWYVNAEFIKRSAPREPGNHDYAARGGRRMPQDAEDVHNTFSRINDLLVQSLKVREIDIIIKLYLWDGPTDRQIGRQYHCSRWTIWREKREIVDRLEKVFEKAGLVSHRYEKPKYLMEEIVPELEK